MAAEIDVTGGSGSGRTGSASSPQSTSCRSPYQFKSRTDSSSRTRGEGSSGSRIGSSVNLVAAARRLLLFFRSVHGADDASPISRHSFRRYEELWLPLVAELSVASSSAPKEKDAPMLLPPPDVDYVWLCHCFNHVNYHEYCITRFGFVIDRPAILDDENEEYAVECCREIWALRFPSEPFEFSSHCDEVSQIESSEIHKLVQKSSVLTAHFSNPFMLETVYIVAAKRRYLDFLHLLKKMDGTTSHRLVPTSDILLMWLTHQTFPERYVEDLADMGNVGEKVVGLGEEFERSDLEQTRMAWEAAYDESYEKAGAVVDPIAATKMQEGVNWEASVAADVNARYKCLHLRFLMEVHVDIKGGLREMEDATGIFLRLRTQKCHKTMRLDKTASTLFSKTWQKAWQLFCEFGTQGIIIEVRRRISGCLSNSKLLNTVFFSWNDLLRTTNLALTEDLGVLAQAMVSVTAPVQMPYLLKCVPDWVTDDSGAMISDVILRMNGYHPQEGRWLSRTVLDHRGKECFVIRMRVGNGIWRRGAETPRAVKWEERIIEVKEGPWSYVASSCGSASGKVVGTATPKKDNTLEKKVIWSFSTGHLLTMQWEHDIVIHLENESSVDPQVSLLRGRKLQYKIKRELSSDEEVEEESYFTLVKTSLDNSGGKATALLNWKLLAVEFSPEEDAVFILLMCMAIARTLTEIRREDVAGLLMRRRVKEVGAGIRDWGSVMLPCSSCTSPHLQPWYWNATQVLALSATSANMHPVARYSPADGKDQLYRQAIIP